MERIIQLNFRQEYINAIIMIIISQYFLIF